MKVQNYLDFPWSTEDTIENLKELKEILQEQLRRKNYEGQGKRDVKEIALDFDRAIQALKEVEQYRTIAEVIKDFENVEKETLALALEELKKYRALGTVEELKEAMEKQPKTDWIPFEAKEADEDEKEADGCEYMLCGRLPDEDEEILVTYSNGCVGEDIFLRDSVECYLDSGHEIVTEAIAWMPKPEPYKKEGAE